MIAITFALPAESSGLIRKLQQKRVQLIKAHRLITGNIHAREVGIFHTGVGREHARSSMEALVSTIQPRVLISSGFAGSVVDRLNVGEVVVAENFSDIQLMERLMEQPATANAVTSVEPATNDTCPAFHRVKLHSVNSMLHTAEDRQCIADQYGVQAIDMETAEIARVCAANSVPMLTLRVISDSLPAPFPAPPDVLFDHESQKTNYPTLIRYLLRHPSTIPRLAAFAAQISRARKALTEALLDAVVRV